jgi:hypothetical protein
MKPKQPRFLDLSDAAKSEAAREFDKEFIADTFRPMNAADRAQWQRIQRKRGRPRHGAGVKVVSVRLEIGLLKQSDALARKLGVSRAALITQGLRRVIAAQTR